MKLLTCQNRFLGAWQQINSEHTKKFAAKTLLHIQPLYCIGYSLHFAASGTN